MTSRRTQSRRLQPADTCITTDRADYVHRTVCSPHFRFHPKIMRRMICAFGGAPRLGSAFHPARTILCRVTRENTLRKIFLSPLLHPRRPKIEAVQAAQATVLK